MLCPPRGMCLSGGTVGMHVGVTEGYPWGQCFQLKMKAAFSPRLMSPFVIKGPAGQNWALPP